MSTVDVLIPTYNRPAALAVTLTSLCTQTCPNFRVVISDQTEDREALSSGEVQAALRVLQSHGQSVAVHRHLPRRGIAEQRQFLLSQATAPYVLFLDDDLILEPWVIELLLNSIQQAQCGFVGNAVIGLSFVEDVRPHEQQIEFWDTGVQPEVVRSNTLEWERWRLHNAANPYHIQQRFNITLAHPRLYKIAWLGGCVMYDRVKLKSIGGFDFWRDIPETACGEDVLVQLRVMSKYGGCGVLPSGVYHQELPTTIVDRSQDAPHLLPI